MLATVRRGLRPTASQAVSQGGLDMAEAAAPVQVAVALTEPAQTSSRACWHKDLRSPALSPRCGP